MTKHIFRRAAVCCIIGIMSVMAAAQDNIYNIDNKLYSLFLRAKGNSCLDEGLRLADTLNREAERLGDRKAQCLAAEISLIHYTMHGNRAQQAEAAEKLRSIATRSGNLEFYYRAGTYEVNRLIDENKIPSAIRETRVMQRHAAAEDNKYGIMTSLRLLGRIYYTRGNVSMALNSYRQALDYQMKYVNDEDPTPIFRNLAMCLRQQNRRTEALQCIEKGLEKASSPDEKRECLREKCLILFDMERLSDFSTTYAQYTGISERQKHERQDGDTEIEICKELLAGNFNKAHELCDRLPIRTDKMKFHLMAYTHEGKYHDAFQKAMELRRYRDSLLDLSSYASMSDMEQLIEREQQRQELLALHLENSELQHDKAERELERTNMQIRLNKAQLRNQQKELDYQRLKSKQENETAEQERLKAEMQARMYLQHRRTAAIIIIGLLAVFTASIGIRYYFVLKLRRKNAQLDEALRKSIQAERMKSLFIRNISHEIRTPLNAIVGFSQLLTSPDYLSDENDRIATCNIINRKSTMLTSLVNDILLLSQLESGEYRTEMNDVPCNYLCRTSLATMENRTNKGLRMSFTTDADDDFILHTSKECVEKVLFALLGNAIKVTEEGEVRLECSLNENPGHVTFAVADTGPGIPEKHDDMIFERFFKINEGEQSKGLGLCISRAMANLIGAELRLDRSYGKGARFVLIVPISGKSKGNPPQ